MNKREELARIVSPEAFDRARFDAMADIRTQAGDFERGQDRAFAKVDAILDALMKPSEAMVKASESAYETDAFGVKSAWASDLFSAMIHAVKEGK